MSLFAISSDFFPFLHSAMFLRSIHVAGNIWFLFLVIFIGLGHRVTFPEIQTKKGLI